MATGTYFTTAGPTVLAGLVVQSEARVRVGTSRLYQSLETTSALYTAYEASIGLSAGNSFDLGELTALGFEYVPTFGSPDSTNVLTSSIETLEEEECTISMGIQQFDPRMLELAVGTGVMYTTGPGGNERVMTVGGKCTTERRPVEIGVTNIGCNAPSAPASTETGITGIVITAYDCQCTSGLPWSDVVAGEINVLDLEWNVRPVNARALGNRLFNVYIF